MTSKQNKPKSKIYRKYLNDYDAGYNQGYNAVKGQTDIKDTWMSNGAPSADWYEIGYSDGTNDSSGPPIFGDPNSYSHSEVTEKIAIAVQNALKENTE